MKVAVAMELRRVLTTRLWWILLAGMVLYVAAMGAFLAAAIVFGQGEQGVPLDVTDPDALASLYGLWPSLAYVFPLVLGTLAVTGEETHRTSTATFLALPRRSTVVLGRALVQAGVGAAFGLAAALACGLPVAVLLVAKGHDLQLAASGVAGNTVGGAVGFALWAVIGVGFGALVRNQILALAVVIGFSQFVEPIARVALALVAPLRSVSSYLPGAAGDALAGSSFFAMAGMGGDDALSQWAGGLVLGAYGAVLLAAGASALLRRDIT